MISYKKLYLNELDLDEETRRAVFRQNMKWEADTILEYAKTLKYNQFQELVAFAESETTFNDSEVAYLIRANGLYFDGMPE
jgi:hypothetical protein